MSGITLERHGAVAVLTVTNPELRNALDIRLAEELIAACDEVDADGSIGAAVAELAFSLDCLGVGSMLPLRSGRVAYNWPLSSNSSATLMCQRIPSPRSQMSQ